MADDMSNMILWVFFLIIFSLVAVVSIMKIIHFKVDVQELGQEEFDRFVLVEKILSAPGCTTQRGIFQYQKVKESNRQCQFSECIIDTDIDWGYTLKSQELGIDTSIDEDQKVGCSKNNGGIPSFKFSQSVPILIYKDGKHYPGNILIYGPDGVITATLSNSRSRSATDDQFYKKDRNEDVSQVDFEATFTCPVREGAGANCIIDSIKSSAQIKTRFGNPKITFSVEVGDNQETVEVSSHEAETWITLHEKWETAVVFSKEVVVAPESTQLVEMVWDFDEDDSTHFGFVEAELNYRVVCSPGYTIISDIVDGQAVFSCNEESIGGVNEESQE